MIRRYAAAILVLGLCPLAAACTSSTSSASSDKGTPSASASASSPPTTTAPPLVQKSVPVSVANNTKARKFVALDSCAAAAGGWKASGTARNTSKSAVSYKITVFFTAKQATVLDYAQTTVKVPAGATKDWSATATFKAPATVLCVLRGVA